MSISRAIKRSIAMLLSMLMIVTSIDMTALLQVHAEGTGSITFADDSEGDLGGTVKYAFGDAEPDITAESGSSVTNVDDATTISFRFTGNTGSKLDTSSVRICLENGDEGPAVNVSDGTYSAEIDADTSYTIRYSFIADDSNDGSIDEPQADPVDPMGDPADGFLSFLDQSAYLPGSETTRYSGTIYYWLDAVSGDGTALTDFSTTINVGSASKIFFSPDPDTNSALDTVRGLQIRVSGEQEPIKLVADSEGLYSYTFTDPSTKRYELEFGFQAKNSQSGSGRLSFHNATQRKEDDSFRYKGTIAYRFYKGDTPVGEGYTSFNSDTNVGGENDTTGVDITDADITRVYVKATPDKCSLGWCKDDNSNLDCPYMIMAVDGVRYQMTYDDTEGAYYYDLTSNGKTVTSSQYQVEYQFAGAKANITVYSDTAEATRYEEIEDPAVTEPDYDYLDPRMEHIDGPNPEDPGQDIEHARIKWDYGESWKQTWFSLNYDRALEEDDFNKIAQFNNEPQNGADANKRSVDYDVKTKDDGITKTVDLTIYMNWSYRPRDVITVNGKDYYMKGSDAAEGKSEDLLFTNFNDPVEWYDACSFGAKDQTVRITLKDIPADDTYIRNGELNVSVIIDVRPIKESECYVGNFLWTNDDRYEGQGKYIGDSELALISVQYPEELIKSLTGHSTLSAQDIADYTFEAEKLEEQMNAKKGDKGNAKYVNYSKEGVEKDENGFVVFDADNKPIPIPGREDGEMLLPEGSLVTMKIKPRNGKQVTKFSVNDNAVDPQEEPGVYTFTIGKGNFHLGAQVVDTPDSFTSDADFIRYGEIILDPAERQTETFAYGTAALEVDDVSKTLNETRKNELEDKIALAGGEVQFVDISLYNTILQGGLTDNNGDELAWETPAHELSKEATVKIRLKNPSSNVVVVHEVDNTPDNPDDNDFSYVALDDAHATCKDGLVEIKTKSFSNFAIATVAEVKAFSLEKTSETLYVSKNPKLDPDNEAFDAHFIPEWHENEQEIDENGDPVYEKDDNGDFVLDEKGDKIPVIAPPYGTYGSVVLKYNAFSDARKKDDSTKIYLNNVTFVSNNADVADVFPEWEDGAIIGVRVHGKNIGIATITATIPDTSFKATCNVSVKVGSVDVTQEEWGPKLDEYGAPVLDDDGKEEWGPTGKIVVNASFPNVSAANSWIKEQWKDHKKNDPNPQKFDPDYYTVMLLDDQTTASAALYYDFDGNSWDSHVSYDLNDKKLTVSTAYSMRGQNGTENNNITIKNGTLVTTKGATLAAGSHLDLVDVEFTSNAFTVSAGAAVHADADTNIVATTFAMSENTRVASAGSITANTSLTINPFSELDVNVLTVKGQTTLFDGATIVNNNTAVFAAIKVMLPKGSTAPDGYVNLVKYYKSEAEQATTTINGAITSDGKTKLLMGILCDKVDGFDEDAEVYDEMEYYTREDQDNNPEHVAGSPKPDAKSKLRGINTTTELYKTNQKKASEYVDLFLPSFYRSYFESIYYDANKQAVFVGSADYLLCKTDSDGSVLEHLGGYNLWNDAMTAVAAINDPSGDYRLDIRKDSYALNNIKAPKAARSMTYKGGSDTNEAIMEGGVQKKDEDGRLLFATRPSIIYYTGDALSLGVNTVFEDLDLVKVTKNANSESGYDTTNSYSVTTLNMQGHDLSFSGEVYFNTAVNFTDSKKTGTWALNDGARLFTALPNLDQFDPNNSTRSNYGGNRAGYYYYGSGMSGYESIALLLGSISGVGTVRVDEGQLLFITDYVTEKKQLTSIKTTFNAPVLNAVTVRNSGKIWVTTYNSEMISVGGGGSIDVFNAASAFTGKTSATITNAYVSGNSILSADALTFTNLSLADRAWVESIGTFNVTSSLSSYTDKATLATAINPANNIPFLTVNGTVFKQEAEDSVQVAVLAEDKNNSAGHYDEYRHRAKFVDLYNNQLSEKPTDSAPLLNAKNGTINDFRPYHRRTSETTAVSNLPAYAYMVDGKVVADARFCSENKNGYFVSKKNNTIYVNDGSQVTIALAILPDDGSAYRNDYNMTSPNAKDALRKADDANAVIGYYATWADAVAAVNMRKIPEKYEFLVLKDPGTTVKEVPDPDNEGQTKELTVIDSPLTLTFPAAANISALTIVGVSDKTNNTRRTLYYTNGWTLTSDTNVYDISLAPVKYISKKNTNVSLPTGLGKPYPSVTSGKTKSAGYISTPLAINATAYNVFMQNTGVAPVNVSADDPTATLVDVGSFVACLGSITGNNKNAIVFMNMIPASAASEMFYIDGSVSKVNMFNLVGTKCTVTGSVQTAGSVICNKGLHVMGNLNTEDVYVQMNAMMAIDGNLTAIDVEAAGAVSFSVGGNANVSMVNLEGVSSQVHIGGSFTSVAAKNKAGIMYDSAVTVTEMEVGGKFTAGYVMITGGSNCLSVTNAVSIGELNLVDDATLSANNTVNISGKVTFGANSKIDTSSSGGYAVTIKDIVVNGNGAKLKYARKPVNKNNYGTTPVNITGAVSGSYDLGLVEVGSYVAKPIVKSGVKAVVNSDTLIASIGTNPTSAFAYSVEGWTSGTVVGDSANDATEKYTLIKSGKGLYYTSTVPSADGTDICDTITSVQTTVLASGSITTPVWQTVDYNSAITQINDLNKQSNYYVYLGKYAKIDSDKAVVSDTIVTDNYPNGTFALPADNKSGMIKIHSLAKSGENTVPVIVRMYGNITGYGDVYFLNVSLDVKSNNTKDTEGSTNITIKKNSKSSSTTGILNIGNNVGSYKIPFVSHGKVGKLNADNLTLSNTSLTTTDVMTTGALKLANTDYNADAQATVATISATGSDSFITVKQNAKSLPMFTLTDKVTTNVYVKVKNAKGVEITGPDIDDVALILATNAAKNDVRTVGGTIDCVRAYELKGNNNRVSYIDPSNYIHNVDSDKILITLLCRTDKITGIPELLGYAKSWNDAIALINNANDGTDYVITFTKEGLWDANGNRFDSAKAPAALTYPKATATSKIKVESSLGSAKRTGLVVNGNFAPLTDFTMGDDVVITGVAKDKPSKMYMALDKLAVVIPNGKTFHVTDKANTSTAPQNKKLAFVSITGKKGSFVADDGAFSIDGNVDVQDFTVNNTVGSGVDGMHEVKVGGSFTAVSTELHRIMLSVKNSIKITNLDLVSNRTQAGSDISCSTPAEVKIDNISVNSNDNMVSGCGKITIGKITGTDADPHNNSVDFMYTFSNPTNRAAGTTLLTISGNIVNADVGFEPCLPMFYNGKWTSYLSIDSSWKQEDIADFMSKYRSYMSSVTPVLDVTDANFQGYTYGSAKTWNNTLDKDANENPLPKGWFNRKLANMGKASTTGLSFAYATAGELFKSGGGVYYASETPFITVEGFTDSGYSSAQCYEGVFFDINEASAEIDRVFTKQNKGYAKITLNKDLGSEETPVGNINLPNNTAGLWIVGEDNDGDALNGKAAPTVYTTATSLALKATETKFDNFGIINRVYDKSAKKYLNNGTYSIAGGKLGLTLNSFATCPTSDDYIAADYSNAYIKDLTAGNVTINSAKDYRLTSVLFTTGNINATKFEVYATKIKVGGSFTLTGTDRSRFDDLTYVFIEKNGAFKAANVRFTGDSNMVMKGTGAFTVTDLRADKSKFYLAADENKDYLAQKSIPNGGAVNITNSEFSTGCTMQASGPVTMGTAILDNGTFVMSDGAVNITKSVKLLNNSQIFAKGDMAKSSMKIAKIEASDGGVLYSHGALTLGDIEGTGSLSLIYRFSAPKIKNGNLTTPGASLLNITGHLGGNMYVQLVPVLPHYNETTTPKLYEWPENNQTITAAYYEKIFDTANAAGTNALDAAKRIYQQKEDESTDYTDKYVYFDQSLATMAKGSAFYIRVGESSVLRTYKSGQKLYAASKAAPITVCGFENESDFDANMYGYQLTFPYGADYCGMFYDYNEAVAEVNRIGSKTAGAANSYIAIRLATDLGSETAPMGAIAMPTNANVVRLVGVDSDGDSTNAVVYPVIYTNSATFTLKTSTVLDNVTIKNRTYDKKSKTYNANGLYSISGGKNDLVLKGFGTYEATTEPDPEFMIGSTSGQQTICINKSYVKDITCGNLSVLKGMTVDIAGKVTSSGNVAIEPESDEISMYARIGGDLSATGDIETNAPLLVKGNVSAGKVLKYSENSGRFSAGTGMSGAGRAYHHTANNVKASELILSDALRAKGAVNAGKSITIGGGSSNVALVAGSAITTGDLVATTGSIWGGGSPYGPRINVKAGGVFTANNITTNNFLTLRGANITVKNVAKLQGGQIIAGTAYEGDPEGTVANKAKDGIITFKDVEVNASTTVSPKKNADTVDKKGNVTKKGVSQFTITGNVCGSVTNNSRYYPGENENSDEPIIVAVRENTRLDPGAASSVESMFRYFNIDTLTKRDAMDILEIMGWGFSSGSGVFTDYAPGEEGMILVNAKNASDNWFRPASALCDGMSSVYIYKSGSTVRFGSNEPEVSLIVYDCVLLLDENGKPYDYNHDGVTDGLDYGPSDSLMSDFATFEEAVAEINSLNRVKKYSDGKNSKYYEDYAIMLRRDVDIKNAKDQYAALTLPTKTGTLDIESDLGKQYKLRYAGGLTLKSNLYIDDVVLESYAYNSKTKLDEKKPGALNMGAYSLDIDAYGGDTPTYAFASVTGTASNKNNNLNLYYARLYVEGNVNVYGIRVDGSGFSQIEAGGSVTANRVDCSEDYLIIILNKGKLLTINGDLIIGKWSELLVGVNDRDGIGSLDPGTKLGTIKKMPVDKDGNPLSLDDSISVYYGYPFDTNPGNNYGAGNDVPEYIPYMVGTTLYSGAKERKA